MKSSTQRRFSKILACVISLALVSSFTPIPAWGVAASSSSSQQSGSLPLESNDQISTADAAVGVSPQREGIHEDPSHYESDVQRDETKLSENEILSGEISHSAALSPTDGGEKSDAPESLSVPLMRGANVLSGTDTVWVNGDSGDDATGDGSQVLPVKTLARAVQLATEDKTKINMEGTFTEVQNVVIPSYITLTAVNPTVISGTGIGITLQNGSVLSAAGTTLTMKGFTTAINAQQGSTIQDGIYNLDNNLDIALNLAGSISGTDKQNLVLNMRIKGNHKVFTFANTNQVSHATLIIGDSDTDREQSMSGQTLHLSNSDVTFHKYYLYNAGFTAQASHLTLEAPDSLAYSGIANTMATSRFENGSTLSIRNGRVSAYYSQVTFIDSTLDIADTWLGGFNLGTNTGSKAVFDNSHIVATNVSSLAFMGVMESQYPSNVTMKNSTVVDTPASGDAYNITMQKPSTLTVLGGSYKVAYSRAFEENFAPTNGDENGNDVLKLFEIPASVNALTPLNAKGERYSYPVEKASADGKKYVFVPSNLVTFNLNNPDATFSDGSTEAKSLIAMRGYGVTFGTYELASTLYSQIDNPRTNSSTDEFLGWYYVNPATGEVEDFTADTPITQDISVFGKWSSSEKPFSVKYSNNENPEGSFIQVANNSSRSAAVLNLADVVDQHPTFNAAQKDFLSWNTAPDGSGQAYHPGDTIMLPEDIDSITLYAQWKTVAFVRFSANGGVFPQSSVFHTHPEAFTVTTDPLYGGEVATLNEGIKIDGNDTLAQALVRTGLSAQALDAYKSVSNEGYISFAPSTWNDAATRSYYRVAPVYTSTKVGTFRKRFTYTPFTDGSYSDTPLFLEVNKPLSQDVTYYIHWKVASGVETSKASATLPSDIWSHVQDTSSEPRFADDGEVFPLTGGIDTRSITSQMLGIEQKFGVSERTEFESIALENTRSVFTASLTLPAGLQFVSTPDQIQVEGLGEAYTVLNKQISGNTFTVSFGLKKQPQTYAELKDMVESTGISSGVMRRSLPTTPGAEKIPESSLISVTVPEVKLIKALASVNPLEVTGKVGGMFDSVAKRNSQTVLFNFTWDGQQNDYGRNSFARSAATIPSYSVVLSQKDDLPGDIRIRNEKGELSSEETEQSSVYQAFAGEEITLVGALDISSIQKKIDAIAAPYTSNTYEDIAIDVKDTTFTSTLTLPGGMSFSRDVSKDVLETEDFGNFIVSDVQVSGKTLTVTMTLKNTTELVNFKQLYDEVHAAGNTDGWMRLMVPGVVFDTNAPTQTNMTVKGTLSGSMSALAWKIDESGAPVESRAYSFAWKGAQWPDGADAVYPGTKDISFTSQITQKETADLPADLLVGRDTEHISAIGVRSGSTTSLTGALNVEPIQQRMQEIEDQYPGINHADIALEVRRFGFSATLTLPAELSVSDKLSKNDVVMESFGGGFDVEDITVAGNQITVRFKLSDAASITTYDRLEAVVDAAGNNDQWMYFTIPAINVKSGLAAETKFTAYGTVQGFFGAKARYGNVSHAYDFEWNGVQWDEGKDVEAPSDDNSIRLTFVVHSDPFTPFIPWVKPPQFDPKPKPQPEPVPYVVPDPFVTPYGELHHSSRQTEQKHEKDARLTAQTKDQAGLVLPAAALLILISAACSTASLQRLTARRK